MTDALPAEPPKKATDQHIRDLFHQGHGRNEIARLCDVTTYRVDQVCKADGLTFNADRTRAAVAVHTASAGEAHRKLAGRFRDLADQALNRANDNIDAPDIMWQYVRAAATSTDKSIALADLDARTARDDSMATAGAALDTFMSLVMDKATPLPPAADDREPEEPP